VNIIVNVWFHKNRRISLTGLATISFSRRTLSVDLEKFLRKSTKVCEVRVASATD
jgi:hypothetical protein